MSTIQINNSLIRVQDVGAFIDGLLRMSPFLPGPLSQIKSSLLGSTSDSNLHKYSTINKIPLITLNFSEANNEKKCPSPPSSEKTIIAPKVKDRTHNVTDKVTQVGAKQARSLVCLSVIQLDLFYCWDRIETYRQIIHGIIDFGFMILQSKDIIIIILVLLIDRSSCCW